MLLCLCGSCTNSDDCGPTSDWPHRACESDTSSKGDDDDNSGASGDDDSAENEDDHGDDEETPSKPQEPSSGGGDTKTPPAIGTDSSSRDSGASAMDAGGVPAGPGGETRGDGGVPDAGPDSGSFGPYGSCSMAGRAGVDAGPCDRAVCKSMARSAGACVNGPDLSLACDGEIGGVVAGCAESEILRLGTGRSVASCARRAPTLSAASTGCIDCYVEEVLCAAEQCFVPCLAGFSEECRACRLSNCGEALQTCSGLYVARELTPRGVDAGL